MSEKRRAAILASLRAGNWIFRYWSGPSRSGYLRHRLDGIERLREAEVEELRREKLLVVMRPGEITPDGGAYLTFSFKPLRLANHPEIAKEMGLV